MISFGIFLSFFCFLIVWQQNYPITFNYLCIYGKNYNYGIILNCQNIGLFFLFHIWIFLPPDCACICIFLCLIPTWHNFNLSISQLKFTPPPKTHTINNFLTSDFVRSFANWPRRLYHRSPS